MTRELAFAVDENGLESLGNRSIAVDSLNHVSLS